MEKRSHADIEKELMSHLSSANLSKEHLSSVSKSIAEAYNSGLRLVDWWIYGIPAFENLVVQAQLPIEEASVLDGFLKDRIYKEILIQKKGIPVPDFFQVNFTINKVAQRGEM